ncbi:MAG: fibronectin type III domain-containing protein, partial [bacterium]
VIDFNVNSANDFHQNNFKTSSTNPDSFIETSLSGETASLTRNYWNTTDQNRLQNGLTASGVDSTTVVPYRLGKVDTGVGADTIGPASPGKDTAIAYADSVVVRWGEVTQDEDGSGLDFSAYRVYRTKSDTLTDWKQNATVIATINNSTDTDYVDSGLQGGDTYHYRVTAVDASTPENESYFSDTSTAYLQWSGPVWYVND